MPIDENELKQMEERLNELEQTKGPEVAGTDKESRFNGLMQQAEYRHWQLSQTKKCADLLDEYYAYRHKAKRSADRRLWLTYIGFFFAYLIALFCFTKFVSHKDAGFIESMEMLGAFSIIALVISGIHFFVNFYIFDHIDLSGIKDLILTFLGFMVFYLIVFIVIAYATTQSNNDSESFLDMLEHIILFSGIASALHIWINNSIFNYLYEKDKDICEQIELYELELRSISDMVDTDTRPIRESIPIWKASVYHCIDELSKL